MKIYLMIINLIAFLAMGVDKRKAVKHKWRIPEKTLMMFSVLGGSLGMFIGMQLFRHKTIHTLFVVGVPLVFIIEIILYICLYHLGIV